MQLFAYIIRYCSFIPDTHTFSFSQNICNRNHVGQPTHNWWMNAWEYRSWNVLVCGKTNSFHMRVFIFWYSVRFSSPNKTSAFNSIQFDRVVSPPKIGRTDFGIYAKFEHSKFIEASHYKLSICCIDRLIFGYIGYRNSGFSSLEKGKKKKIFDTCAPIEFLDSCRLHLRLHWIHQQSIIETIKNKTNRESNRFCLNISVWILFALSVSIAYIHF